MTLPFQLPAFEFYQRLSARERLLALIVGGTVFLLVNIILLSTLLKSFREARAAYHERAQGFHLQELLARDSPMWTGRMAWLKSKQPPLVNRDRAGTELLDQVQAAARASQVVITNPQIKPAPRNQAGTKEIGSHDYQAVSVEVETESDWAGTVHFLQSLQKPEGFVVFDLATLRSDPGNASQMKGHFGISKWYAPVSK